MILTLAVFCPGCATASKLEKQRAQNGQSSLQADLNAGLLHKAQSWQSDLWVLQEIDDNTLRVRFHTQAQGSLKLVERQIKKCDRALLPLGIEGRRFFARIHRSGRVDVQLTEENFWHFEIV